MGIKIGNLDISALKMGSASVTAYLGDVLIYSGGTPPTPSGTKWTVLNACDEYQYSGNCNASSTYSSADTLAYVALVEAGGRDCYDARTIEFDDCVTSIAYDCLADGNGNNIGYIIQAIIIPSSVTYIADEAFINTPGGEDIVCYATTPPTLGGLDAFGSGYYGTIYVPDEALSDYQNDSDWSNFDLKGLSDRMNYRFKLIDEFDGEYISDCDPALTSVSTDDDFSNANYTYSGTPVEIYVGDCVETVDDDTFSGATALTKVVLGKNIYEIRSGAFNDTNGSFILICLAGTPPTLSNHIFSEPNGGIYVPDDSVNDYKQAPIWEYYAQGILPLSDLQPSLQWVTFNSDEDIPEGVDIYGISGTAENWFNTFGYYDDQLACSLDRNDINISIGFNDGFPCYEYTYSRSDDVEIIFEDISCYASKQFEGVTVSGTLNLLIYI